MAKACREPTRVTWVVSTLRRSGPTHQLYSLLTHLDRERFEPSVLSLSPEPPESRRADFEQLGVHCQSLNLSRWQGTLLTRRQLKHHLEALRTDLVHSHGIRPDVLAARLGNRYPRLATVHNFPELDYRLTYGALKGSLMVRAHVAALRRLELCVGVSGAVARNLSERYGIRSTAAVTNGVEALPRARIAAQERARQREALGLPAKVIIFVAVGHLSPRKNPLFLIDQWKAQVPEKGTACLLLLGDGELRDACRQHAGGCSSIRILGRVPNVEDYLLASDYYVSPSVGEGLPMAALEALATGLPLLLSDIPPHREILDLEPRAGRLFRLHDAEDFGSQLTALLTQEREPMAAAGHRLARDELSAAHMAQRYQEHYEALLA